MTQQEHTQGVERYLEHMKRADRDRIRKGYVVIGKGKRRAIPDADSADVFVWKGYPQPKAE